MDLILNGQAQGAVATTLLNNGFDMSALRPWIGKDGRSYIAMNRAGKLTAVPLNNATATLRKDEWKVMDEAIVRASRERLRAVADLRSAGLTFNIPNGMSKTVLETETMSDITPATVSMDPAKQGEGDRPEYDLKNLPLPVIHKDYYFNARQIAVSRERGTPLDTTMAEQAARQVAVEAEKLVIGVGSNINYGGGVVYGYTNFPQRITSVDLTRPTAGSWSGKVLVSEVLAMRQASEDALHFGPWVMYVAKAWDKYLDEDYSDVKGDQTLRDRLKKINGITEIRTLDHMEDFDIVLVQQTSDVARLVIGMDITTVQWETLGGLRLNFKVMAIMVPQLRSDFYSRTGVVHAVGAS